MVPTHLTELSELLAHLPQAAARVDVLSRVVWLEPAFAIKTGFSLAVGQPLSEVLEPGPAREQLEAALLARSSVELDAVTTHLTQVRLTIRPARGLDAWVLLQPSGLDDQVAFAEALGEIAHALSQTLDVDAVCAAAVLAMVRCTPVTRAEVHLVEEGWKLRRVASSDVGDRAALATEERTMVSFQHALATRQPEIGIACADGSLFAAVPLTSQKRTVGLLVLYKEKGAAFSVRELDLWSAAAGQLAVAVENARLLRESQAALKAREEFMSIASHELKTPLTPLKMCLYSMERKLAQGAPVDYSLIVKSQRQVDRLTALVNDLLDASRLERGKLAVNRKPLELSQLVLEVVEHFRASSDREYLIDGPPKRLWVMGDRDRLEQVLVNLLENASKYSAAGEPVRVAIEGARDEVLLHVSDRGIGIPAHEQMRIFQRFYRATNASGRNFAGLGLGLFISQSIVRLHGGTLTLRSVEGQGSTFTVRLPRLADGDVKRLPRRVLVVDEEPVALTEVCEWLRGAGFEVVPARDGGEALRRASQAPPDAVVVSGTLPRGDLFAQTVTSLPLMRSLPMVVLGDEPPDWAGRSAALCPRSRGAERLASLLHRVFQPDEPVSG